MLNDTLNSVENQFLDGLKAIHGPTIKAARQTTELLAKLPLLGAVASLPSPFPSTQEVVTRNFEFGQRLFDAQREFAAGLASAATLPATKPAKKTATG